MHVMRVIEAENAVVFAVASDDRDFRALQLVDRDGDTIYANTRIEVGDLVLVEEVPGFLLGPNTPDSEVSESISHIIVGLIPPSNWHEIPEYSKLVKGL